MHATILLPLLGLGCIPSETGINRTVVEGTVLIPPQEHAEAETAQGQNDSSTPADGAAPEDLGYLSYRPVLVTGRGESYGLGLGGKLTGDQDWYAFSPLVGGDLGLALTWSDNDPTTADTGETVPELVAYQVTVVDLDDVDDQGNPTVLLDTDTTGSYGAWSASVTVEAGGHYAIGLGGRKNYADEPDQHSTYELVLSGFDPNEAQFLVGAYPSADPSARGNPLGGTSVESFEQLLDDESLSLAERLTWRGAYTAWYMREVVAAETETGLPDVDEGVEEAWLFAGNFPSLNAAIGAGTLYSVNPTYIRFGADAHVQGADITVNYIQPKVYGWTCTDTETNNVEIDGSGNIVKSGAQACPEATGIGFVDVIQGTLEYESDDPQWAGENDAFTITVPETMTATMTMSWADTSYNIDLDLNDPSGTLAAAGWAVADVNPESFASGDFGVVFEPGQTYTVVVLPWSGPAGSVDYTIEIEWSAP